MKKEDNLISVFIGYDSRERAAANVLIDSIYQKSSIPVSITPLITSQLKKQKLFYRKRDKNQSTDFSFTRFLVPNLMGYKGWAIFMDCDMLCRVDISKLWSLREEDKSLMCVKHKHNPKLDKKFLGEKQTKYQKKNWSSLMLFNCAKCKALTIDYVNKASGLDLHQFKWLKDDSEIGNINDFGWNFLINVQELPKDREKLDQIPLIHWTLGGPWFRENDNLSKFDKEWFKARDDSMKI